LNSWMSPGEWSSLDDASGTLYYMPRAGEQDLPKVQPTCALLVQVLRSRVGPRLGQYVEHVGHARPYLCAHRVVFPGGLSQREEQAEYLTGCKAEAGGFRPGGGGGARGVWGEGLRDCVFEECRFSNLGNYGLEFDGGCQGKPHRAMRILGPWRGGMKIGEGRNSRSRLRSNAAATRSCCAACLRRGQDVWQRDWHLDREVAQQSPSCIISFTTSIILASPSGWTWGTVRRWPRTTRWRSSRASHWREVGRVTAPILSEWPDSTPLGKQPGTTIRNNLWHEHRGHPLGGWGNYFDEGSSGIVAESNVVYRTTHGGFHQHYGEDQRLPQQHPRVRARPADSAFSQRAATSASPSSLHCLFRLRQAAGKRMEGGHELPDGLECLF